LHVLLLLRHIHLLDFGRNRQVVTSHHEHPAPRTRIARALPWFDGFTLYGNRSGPLLAALNRTRDNAPELL
jgi:hypothetical protein